ncbi:MAG: AMP-binding protein, partial [Spirochaetota bacterium]
MDTITIKSMEDIHNIEKVPFEDRLKAGNVYDLLKKGSEINQDATAITFFFNGEQYENPMDISYRDFFLGVNSAANMFYDLGVRSDDKVAYILGNFPQTHYTLWGAETAGIACPINPLLEPSALKDILNSLKAKVLVTLGDIPGVDIWSKVDSIRSEIPSLEYILQVFGTTDEKENIYSYDELVTQYFG